MCILLKKVAESRAALPLLRGFTISSFCLSASVGVLDFLTMSGAAAVAAQSLPDARLQRGSDLQLLLELSYLSSHLSKELRDQRGRA